ncbi:DNA helicase [Microbacterium phage Hendrix]|uniref:Helicase n=1 Tax=Microbacterium phage Hendrix TaxID=2182341 RepID=A0A2U8UUV2_9CAUD|nr:DNA helicase [Microbacterium phage Hendrix]AWN07786.1 helicase [Microbacterium phage Hendrix]
MTDDVKPKNLFVPGGPERYQHQKRGLQKIIQTRGVCALLFDPGTGKTATTLDFISLLALKSPDKLDSFGRLVKEARVLVVAPLAAIDTWVLQSSKWVADGVNFWAEALGGSILDRAETMAARGGQPFLETVSRFIMKAQDLEDQDMNIPVPFAYTPPRTPRWVSALKKSATFLHESGIDEKRSRTSLKTKFSRSYPMIEKKVIHETVDELCATEWAKPLKRAPRALNVDKAIEVSYRADSRGSDRPLTLTEGPDGLGKDKPRIVLLATNFDTFQTRQMVPGTSKSMADQLLEAVRRFDPDLVVVDEAHKIKSPRSNVSRLLGRIGENVPRRIALTGTIMPAGPLDVWGVWRFLEPFAFGPTLPDGTKRRLSYEGFKEKYAVLGGYMGKEVKGYKNLDEMQNIMSINSSVARKADALPDLPKALDVEVPIILNPAELKAYKDMKQGLVAQLIDPATGGLLPATAGSRLTQMLRLRQITSGHLPDDNGGLHRLGDSKVAAIASIAEDKLIGENRIVIFCYFIDELHALQKKLERDGNELMIIDGSTPATERLKMRQRFGDRDVKDRIIMITQIRTMSLAVNELVTASHAIFGSLPQTRDDIVQARDRLDRIGQTLPCTFWFVLAPATIDTAIYQSYRDKTSLEGAVLAHILDLDPETAEQIMVLTPDQLASIGA